MKFKDEKKKYGKIITKSSFGQELQQVTDLVKYDEI